MANIGYGLIRSNIANIGPNPIGSDIISLISNPIYLIESDIIRIGSDPTGSDIADVKSGRTGSDIIDIRSSYRRVDLMRFDGLRRTRRRAGEGMNRLFDPPRGLVVPGVTGGAMTARSTRTRGRRAQAVIDVHFLQNGVVLRRSSWKGFSQTAPLTVHRCAKFDKDEDCAISEADRTRWSQETLV